MLFPIDFLSREGLKESSNAFLFCVPSFELALNFKSVNTRTDQLRRRIYQYSGHRSIDGSVNLSIPNHYDQ